LILVANRRFARLRTVAGLCLALLCLLPTGPLQGQDASSHKRFTNQDVISLAQLGMSDDVIVTKIRSMAAKGPDAFSFDTSVDGLKALKAANVSDAVIQAMINPAPPPMSAPAAASTAAPVFTDPNLPPAETGVYWKDGVNFVMIQGQAITNMKAGGRAGAMFTNGLRNEHWDAYVEGPKSKNILRERRPAFYLYVPDGSDASDYVLIKMNKKGNRREFQVGSFGGITGGKSGVKRDKELAFNAEHVGIRSYRLTLDSDLKPGEYAFFMGTGQTNTMSAGGRGGNRSGGAATGRVYDFSIPE
jgi:hypothetical protein